jgi:hypothetical protein
VTRFIYRGALVCLIPLLPLTAYAGAATDPNETSLRAADAEELRIILAGDAHAEQAFMHPNYIVNSPANRIVRKDQLIKMLSEGQIASDSIERTIEATAITGNVGIVMGREIVKPKPTSELGRLDARGLQCAEGGACREAAVKTKKDRHCPLAARAR